MDTNKMKTGDRVIFLPANMWFSPSSAIALKMRKDHQSETDLGMVLRESPWLREMWGVFSRQILQTLCNCIVIQVELLL